MLQLVGITPSGEICIHIGMSLILYIFTLTQLSWSLDQIYQAKLEDVLLTRYLWLTLFVHSPNDPPAND